MVDAHCLQETRIKECIPDSSTKINAEYSEPRYLKLNR